MRDSQKSKLYRAEAVLMEHGGRERLETTDEIKDWVDSLARYQWFRRRWGRFDVRVKDGRGARIARGGGRTICMPRWSRTKAVIIHEVAHCVAPAGSKHGWAYAATLRELTRFVFGEEAERALVASFKQHRVRYKRPRRATRPAGNIEALRRWREAQAAKPSTQEV